ncbi:MAG: amidohydrolase family protein [Verrucomicrobiae bacterium]|nr:amidohydrolase family protein [Verrucomicrobiae bacterium]
MIIDAHTHLFNRYGHLRGLNAKQFVGVLDKHDINMAGLFTLTGFLEEPAKYNNDLAAAVKEFPDRLYAFCTVNPRDGEKALRELRRCRFDLALPGIKLHPWLQAFSVTDPMMFPILEESIKLNMPIIFHDGSVPFSTPSQIGLLADLYPEAKLILGHAGLKDFFREAILVAQRHKNVFLCPSGVPVLGIKLMTEKAGADRMMFGSDLPFGGEELLVHKLNTLRGLEITDAERSMILGGTICKMLNLKPT